MSEHAALPQSDLCQECGCSLVPLAIPHTKRKCEKCGKDTYVCEAGKKGGIVIRAGDQFTIPAGFIKLSLDPNNASVLTRHGIPWFINFLFSRGEVGSQDKIGATLDSYIAEGEHVLKKSELLKQCNLEDDAQAPEVEKLLEQNQGKPEWWALTLAVLAGEAKRSLETTDTHRTAWVMSKLATCRAMLLFHQELEQHVWSGYSAAHLRHMLTLWKANERTPTKNFGNRRWHRTH